MKILINPAFFDNKYKKSVNKRYVLSNKADKFFKLQMLQ